MTDKCVSPLRQHCNYIRAPRTLTSFSAIHPTQPLGPFQLRFTETPASLLVIFHRNILARVVGHHSGGHEADGRAAAVTDPYQGW
jgi:hypothetical protein